MTSDIEYVIPMEPQHLAYKKHLNTGRRSILCSHEKAAELHPVSPLNFRSVSKAYCIADADND